MPSNQPEPHQSQTDPPPHPADSDRGLTVCRGVRGATTVSENSAESILDGTRELLERMIAANGIVQNDVTSVFFTTTADVNAEYPALAARQLGWHDAALMCGHEMAVPKGLKLCIRVLIHWNTARPMAELQHIYIRGAAHLRPDRSISEPFIHTQPTESQANKEQTP